jgi:hypothetical protein
MCDKLAYHIAARQSCLRERGPMAGGRKPGPQLSQNDWVNIDDGTMCLAQSPMPGPLGSPSVPLGKAETGECVSRTLARATRLASMGLHRQIGLASAEVLEFLIPSLIKALSLQTAGTPKGAVLSHFGNPLPAVRSDGNRGILTLLGLEFLPESIDSGLVEMTCFLQSGISMARHAGEHKGGQRDSEVERAAEELARAISLLVRALLLGIVTYLENASKGTTLPTDATVAQLVANLRSSALDSGFAIWVERNWKELLKNPRLRITRLAGSVSAESVRVSSARTPRVAAATFTQPDPPTFSPDVRLAAQAATLVAAAAQGAPFCPL